MTTSIRSFRNTDLDLLCSIWNEHHADLGLECSIDRLQLELICLAKPYFEPEHLQIAETAAGEGLGFIHHGPVADAGLGGASHASRAISALCVKPGPHEDGVAEDLLNHCLVSASQTGIPACRFKPVVPDCPYYLGLGPADTMAGVLPCEQRVRKWLNQAGFETFQPTCHWELDLGSFQAPIDRSQIQIRRASNVNQQLDEPSLPWWQACVLGHTEPVAFQLSHKSEKRVLQEVLYWSMDPDLQSGHSSVVWLWPPESGDDEYENELTFLLAESMRQLQAERVDSVRTVTSANDHRSTTRLRRLGFQLQQDGAVFMKRLDGSR